MTQEPLLQVEQLRRFFAVQRGLTRRTLGHVQAVKDISLSVNAGECFSIVGESGCGKTTLARCILRLIEADGGHILLKLGDRRLHVRQLRGRRQMLELRRHMQVVFQDPFSSLDPRMNVSDIVSEPLVAQGIQRRARSDRVAQVLEQVGLSVQHAERYPHELSGGQRQRVGIARALAIKPSLLVLDEPVSALDVSVRAQILNLLLGLQQQMALTYVFISHDLSIVKHLSDRVGVMYLGEMVEVGTTRDVFEKPRHPYTEALLSAIPAPRPGARHERIVLHGDLPSPLNPPTGCRFSTRCTHVQDVCRVEEPALRSLADGRLARCHFAEELDLIGGRQTGVLAPAKLESNSTT